MDPFYARSQVELILVEDENDISDPLALPESNDNLDIPTECFQLNDEIDARQDFRLKPIKKEINYKQDVKRAISIKNEVENDYECASNSGGDIWSESDAKKPVDLPVEQALVKESRDSEFELNQGAHIAVESTETNENRRNSKARRESPVDKKIVTEIKQKKSVRSCMPLEAKKCENPFRCKICDISFGNSPNFTEHMRKEHSIDKAFECHICSKTYRIQSLLAEHIKFHTGEKPYGCETCDRRFSQLQPYKAHVRTHTGERPYKCTHCEETFIDTKTLKSHVRKHTGTEPYECDVCHRKFLYSGTYKAHTRTHTGERPYQCAICGKSFSQTATHRTHMRTHTGEASFECKVCDKRFSQALNYKIHMRTHTGERPYKCDMCDRSFAQSKTYRTHMLVHSGEKPFQCSFCGKSFRHSNTFKHHLRTHTGEQPHQCNVCGKKFCQKVSLKKHMKKHNQKIDTSEWLELE